jgi:hypothetical protein
MWERTLKLFDLTRYPSTRSVVADVTCPPAIRPLWGLIQSRLQNMQFKLTNGDIYFA